MSRKTLIKKLTRKYTRKFNLLEASSLVKVLTVFTKVLANCSEMFLAPGIPTTRGSKQMLLATYIKRKRNMLEELVEMMNPQQQAKMMNHEGILLKFL
jgi:hypothetical protein